MSDELQFVGESLMRRFSDDKLKFVGHFKGEHMHTIPLPAVRKAVFCLLVALLLSLTQGGATLARAGSNVSGVVLDSSGATVAVASVSLLSAQQVTVGLRSADGYLLGAEQRHRRNRHRRAG